MGFDPFVDLVDFIIQRASVRADASLVWSSSAPSRGIKKHPQNGADIGWAMMVTIAVSPP